ncbi:hypothetical protein [Oceanobacillus damuensis]|uniref:hypothetical protein n=1 Tax=Oceanobacillus damuensis TaxID=937928 RepID=UPI000836B737|nr:hypothetical protein [Oceanobacillus damuensis]
MKMKSDNSNEQTDELRRIFDELERENEQKDTDHTAEPVDTREKREVDILNLPPRKEIHANPRMHIKMSRPFFRFLFVLLLLIIIVIGVYYFLGDELFSSIK